MPALPGLPLPPSEGSSPLALDTFRGQTVAITGGGTGLGKAIGMEFARLGATVAILSRNEQHHTSGIAAIHDAGGEAFAVACDVRDDEAVEAAFAAIRERAGNPSMLVNNAAGNFPVPAEDLSPRGWKAVTDIVLSGTFHCSGAFARPLIAAGTGGTIINIGASYAWTGGPGFVHSSAAKAGVKNMTETLAVEWAPYGIRVNNLVPGLFPHEDETGDIRAVPGRGDRESQRSPALRTGLRREIGWAAVFLASPYANFITGATLAVDGANWQRRSMLQPPFVPIAEQLGR